ncbi:bifunctional adenosylcobinamide kinase/adenosylcobinamide-phosphate guanylyltransferase [Sulfurimonas paralvinellae]|uniref:Adenosylcobinamide kinase n=1 Tax=Sulfurimonas paralvinellae TaxID=317658 RepID=A0A7M1B518_9BACT|nr:bifunctional adenosylcobinamide kinase/adenosylcobinamide-phosphate guanylyltransferase [Sulfurimonas paralvinellae]QOP44824.1 bifunctional adenosylcobinamide kinase/adenosylcobinamide-phosphate guanylyltransferase [Sulfurimonas paralvinellae]
MKVLFIGGIKSGKSLNAEKYIQKISKAKPVYLATTEFIDDETKQRIQQHQKQRSDNFITVEEALVLSDEIEKHEKTAVLVECLSVWVNNMLYHEKSFEDMQEEINKVMMQERDVVFVINDVSCGVIPENALARKFVDVNGKIAQLVAAECDEVYHVVAGIATKIK